MQPEQRRELAGKMFDYYQTTASYFDEVKAIAPDRPSEEELALFRALVQLRGSSDSEPHVLELGCGRGESASQLMKMLGGSHYHAIEASADAVVFARQQHPRFQIEVGDISRLPYPEASFDVVVLNYVLEHTCEPDRVLSEALRVMRPGALIGMIVPVCDLPWSTPQSLRHRVHNPLFILNYSVNRWSQLLRLRYLPGYFAFPLVADPIVLAQPGLPFLPDDDQVYVASTLEIAKYLRHQRCEVLFTSGRDISSSIQNGRRPWVDRLRTLAFWGLRASLFAWDARRYTDTVSIVARKLS